MKEENNINYNIHCQRKYSNDYSYPTLKREDLMYLSSIDERDYPRRKIKQLNTKRNWSLNLFNLDIEKSTPKKFSKFLNKIDFINKTDDIENAQPQKQKILKYPNFILNTRDIEKAFPSKNLHLLEKKKLNTPKIELNKKQEENTQINKFIKNPIDIKDIEGTKPKSLYRNYIKINNSINEFEKESPYKRIKEKQYFYDNMNYKDVYENKKKFRNTNPLDPDYGINYGGDIEKSHPYIPSYHIKNRGNLYMSNDDIKGSLPGSKNKFNYYNFDRSYIYNINDIDGAVADSKKYGIVTKRCTNPLNPKYQYLGYKENLDCYGRKKKNEKFEISKENEGAILGISNKFNNGNNGIFGNRDENRRYEFDKDKMVSQSCNNIFYKGENKKNNDIYNSILLNYNKDNYQKPIFNPDDFKKPNPNYERIHNENLKFSRKNPDKRLDNILKKNMALFPSIKNNDKNYIENIRNNIQDAKNTFRLNHSNSARLMPIYNRQNKYENRIIKDTLYSKINEIPSYEVQLSNYLKDNSYKP